MKRKQYPAISSELQQLLARFENEERPDIERLFQAALAASRKEVTVDSLWEQPELAATYWILLLSGVNQDEEVAIAETLLLWKAFFSKDFARVLCIQSSEHSSFRFCSGYFGVTHCPTLIISDHPEMMSFLKIGPDLLYRLSSDKGGLQQFFTRIHSAIENGITLSDLDAQLRTERFWRGLKLVYKEAKSLISLNIEAKSG